jgi:hypothetical protein
MISKSSKYGQKCIGYSAQGYDNNGKVDRTRAVEATDTHT